MDFTKVTTQELAIFSNKLVAYIQDIDKALLKLDQMASLNTKTLLFDITGRRENLVKKTVEAQKMYNKIHIELEQRASKKIGFKFDYAKITKTIEDIDKVYYEYFNSNKKN